MIDIVREMFAESKGSPIGAAKFISRNGVLVDLTQIGEDDWDRLYSDYCVAHEENGIPVSSRDDFVNNVKANIPKVNRMSSFF